MKMFMGCYDHARDGVLCEALNIYVDNVIVESWPESTPVIPIEAGKPIGGCKPNRDGENANMLCRNQCQIGIST